MNLNDLTTEEIKGLLNVQKVLLKQSTLSGAYLKAMDTNRDSKVTAIDLLNVQKHILGINNISQG